MLLRKLICHISMMRTADASCSSLLLQNYLGKAELEGKAQSEVVVPVVGRIVVPIRHTAVPRVVVPTATTIHAVRAPLDTLLW